MIRTYRHKYLDASELAHRIKYYSICVVFVFKYTQRNHEEIEETVK